MSARAPRFEVVRTDAGWHARFVAANGQTVWATESYTRRHNTKKAILSVAQAFTLAAPPYFTFRRDDLYVFAQGVGTEVREVDERTTP